MGLRRWCLCRLSYDGVDLDGSKYTTLAINRSSSLGAKTHGLEQDGIFIGSTQTYAYRTGFGG